jgi:septal ring factor EnvC (AmiA/AmiB activator)
VDDLEAQVAALKKDLANANKQLAASQSEVASLSAESEKADNVLAAIKQFKGLLAKV